MGDRFRFDDAFIPVPPSAVDADPAATIEDLLFRVGKLERALEEERQQAVTDQREMLLQLISLCDDITLMVEKWGVTTKAQEAAIVRGIVALGRKLIAILKQHQVEPISTIGSVLDLATSDASGREEREGLAADTVLRETQVGYRWRQGVLRRAKVVVSRPAPSAVAAAAPASNPADSVMAGAAGTEPNVSGEGLGTEARTAQAAEIGPTAEKRG